MKDQVLNLYAHDEHERQLWEEDWLFDIDTSPTSRYSSQTSIITSEPFLLMASASPRTVDRASLVIQSPRHSAADGCLIVGAVKHTLRLHLWSVNALRSLIGI